MSPIHAAGPWLSQLGDAQRAAVDPPATVVHSFRAAVARATGHTALAHFDGRPSNRETYELSPTANRAPATSAFACLRPGAAAEPDSAYCAERPAAYKYPHEVEVLPELPKATSGKILRREPRSPA
ncbi:hypothetical protein [Streptomyces sp. NPDC003023]|uniref:hypothetical protein n=1 Tax=Streptomyces sp. NPDC003023 TaxID=3364675 RepID=UPI0036CD6EBC